MRFHTLKSFSFYKNKEEINLRHLYPRTTGLLGWDAAVYCLFFMSFSVREVMFALNFKTLLSNDVN